MAVAKAAQYSLPSGETFQFSYDLPHNFLCYILGRTRYKFVRVRFILILQTSEDDMHFRYLRFPELSQAPSPVSDLKTNLLITMNTTAYFCQCFKLVTLLNYKTES